jgi:uncharacterized lipoprotein YddW (UPF0748 family)
MKKILLSVFLLLGLIYGLSLREETVEAYVLPEYVQPMIELRGAWVATVANIDISRQANSSDAAIQAWKNQYIAILDNLEALNMNAVFFQVRPTNDAFYESNLNPWSAYLLGHGIDPGWDPMAWMIEVTHARGMEYHAWLNPYRVSPGDLLQRTASLYTASELLSIKQNYLRSLSSKSFARQNQNLVIFGERETKLILNPARQETIDFVTATVVEIMTKYEVDGIHFDDYFYPTRSLNPVDGMTGISVQKDVEDYDFSRRSPAEQTLYPNTSAGRAAWRRANVDRMVKSVSDAVSHFNSTSNRSRQVRFGISPAGVWAPSAAQCPGDSRAQVGGMDVPCGSYSSYLDLYADTRKWVVEEWIDYIVPQAYYTLASTYSEIASWWALQARGTKVNVYVGMGLYRYGDTSGWTDTYEIVNQLRFNQNYPEIKGVIFFSYKSLISSNALMRTAVTRMKALWTRATLLPSYLADAYPAESVPELSGLKYTNKAYLSFTEVEDVSGYLLYKFGTNETPDFNDQTKIVQLFRQISGNSYQSIVDDVSSNTDVVYYLKAVGTDTNFSIDTSSVTYQALGINTAPVVDTFEIDQTNAPFGKGETIRITGSVSDIDGQNLTLTMLFAEDGIDFRHSYAVTNVNNTFDFSWNAFYIAMPNAKFMLRVYDGDLTTEYVSESMPIGIDKAATPVYLITTVTHDTITITPQNNLEYSLDNENWTEDLVFSGLDSNATYTVYARVKETQLNYASDNYSIQVTTTKAPQILQQPFQFIVTHESIQVLKEDGTEIEGIEASLDGIHWSGSSRVIGLGSNQEYTLRFRLKETTTSFASAIQTHTFTTLKPSATAPNRIEVEVRGNTITIKPQHNAEYSIDGINWTDNNVFSGLEYETEYTVSVRRKETDNLLYSSAVSETVMTKSSATTAIIIGSSATVATGGIGTAIFFLLKRKKIGI